MSTNLNSSQVWSTPDDHDEEPRSGVLTRRGFLALLTVGGVAAATTYRNKIAAHLEKGARRVGIDTRAFGLDQGEVQDLMSQEEYFVVENVMRECLADVGYTCNTTRPQPRQPHMDAHEPGYDVDVMVRIHPCHQSNTVVPPQDFTAVCAQIRDALTRLGERFPGRKIGVHVSVDPLSINRGSPPSRSLSDVVRMLADVGRPGQSEVNNVTAMGAQFAAEAPGSGDGFQCHALHTVTLNDSTVSDAHIDRLRAVAPGIRELHVSHTQVSGMAPLRGFRNLQVVGIAGLPIRADEVLTSGCPIRNIHLNADQSQEYEKLHGQLEPPRQFVWSE